MAGRAARPFEVRGLRTLGLPITHLRSIAPARRVALAGVIALAVGPISGIPDFGWVEGAQLLVAVSALRVIARALEEAPFPLPFHDGTLLATGGVWAAAVTMLNLLFDGADQGGSLISLAGCVALTLAGLRVRAMGDHYWFE